MDVHVCPSHYIVSPLKAKINFSPLSTKFWNWALLCVDDDTDLKNKAESYKLQYSLSSKNYYLTQIATNGQ